VDAAASAAEAVGKLDEQEYELVLSDLQMESPEAGLKVLAHARNMDYKPATAIVTTYQNHQHFKPLKQSRMLTSTPMLRAVPLTLRMAASTSKQFRSGILILAISSTCFSGDLADLRLVRLGRSLRDRRRA
jgi:CheY-like chemotaxis protein